MVPCKYTDKGETLTFDLSTAVRVAKGFSGVHEGWSATIVFDPASSALIELSSAPQDIRGNAPGSAIRVNMSYVVTTFGVSEQDVLRLASRRT